jgi:hypothetical protein
VISHESEVVAEDLDYFLRLRNWTCYHKIKPAEVADEHLVRQGKFVTWEYHIVHCVYTWWKLHRAIIPRPHDRAWDRLYNTQHPLIFRLEASQQNNRKSQCVI